MYTRVCVYIHIYIYIHMYNVCTPRYKCNVQRAGRAIAAGLKLSGGSVTLKGLPSPGLHRWMMDIYIYIYVLTCTHTIRIYCVYIYIRWNRNPPTQTPGIW